MNAPITLADLRADPRGNFYGLTAAERVLRVCTLSLREGKRVITVHLTPEMYAGVERFGMQYPHCFTWERDGITWRVLSGEVKIRLTNSGCIFGFDDGTGLELDINPESRG